MPAKNINKKLTKHRICSISRVIACVSFLILAIIGVSSLVRAMSLEHVTNQDGIPAAWQVGSLGRPDTITVPITYWDQRQDDCSDPNRQFEWVQCGYWTSGTIQGVVKDHLGSDGTPVPSFTNNVDAWNANLDVFTANVTGHDPLQTTDNFYRWFHNTEKSKSYDRTITFNRVGNTNTYSYDSGGFFPLDDVNFSAADEATKEGHNYHFTAHMSIAMKVAANGLERFEFSGDDDVWVFLNGKLVLDLGGLHEILTGHFTINQDGSITAYTQSVNDPSVRSQLGEPSSSFNDYVNPLNELNRQTAKDKTITIDAGLKAGDIVNLDFFYAERSTTASNNKITISNMNWPISADSNIDGKIIGKLEDSESNLVQYDTYVKNRDPKAKLNLLRLSSFVEDEPISTNPEGDAEDQSHTGFIPLDIKTLQYTTTPNDESSWTPVEITPPMDSMDGFSLATPLTMQPSGQDGDTLYFRFFAETSDSPSGTINNLTAYYTELNGVSGVTYDNVTIPYTGKTPEQPTPTYNVTVNYVIEHNEDDPDNGVEAPETFHGTYKDGSPYNVPTPPLENYTPDQSVVSGVIEGQDVVETVTYTKNSQEEPKKQYNVLIEYLHNDTHEPILPEYNHIHNEGESFTIIPGDVDGFTKNRSRVEISVTDHDIHEVVYYTPKTTTPVNPNPETPVTPGPTTPTEPTDPESPLPILPLVPGSDEGLVFIAPLGEVAYVPNTGVVNSSVAPIFEQYFASIILSQGFVMTMLIIFSASFAAYFSLRRHLSLSPNARSAASVKKMPKSVANSKTARSMKKAATKTTKTVKASKPTKTTSTTKKSTRKSTTAPTKTAKSTKVSKTTKPSPRKK